MARLASRFLTFLLFAALLVAAAMIWRAEIVEAAAKAYVSSLGLEDARFEVVEVGATGAVIENAALGEAVGARRLHLSYDLADLAAGRLHALRIEGLRIDARGDALERLQSLASGEGGGSAGVGRIALEQATVLLPPPADGAIRVDGELDLSGRTIAAELEVVLDLRRATGAFTVVSGNLGEGGAAQVAGGAEVDLAGLTLPGGPDLVATGGAATLALEGTASIPGADQTAPEAWLAAALSLDGDLRLDGVATSAGPEVLSADIGWSLRGEGDGMRLALPRPALITIASLSPDALATLRLPAGWSDQTLSIELAEGPLAGWSPRGDGGTASLAATLSAALGGAALELRAGAEASHGADWSLAAPATLSLDGEARGVELAGAEGRATATRAAWTLEGSVDPGGALELAGPVDIEAGALSSDAIAAETVSLAADVAVRRAEDGGWSVSLAPGAEVVLAGAASPGVLEIPGEARATVERLDAIFGPDGVAFDVAAALDPVSGMIGGEEGGRVAFDGAAGRIAAEIRLGDRVEGTLRLAGAVAALPDAAVAFSEIDAVLPLGGPAPAALRLSGIVEDTGREKRFAPMRVALAGEGGGARATVSGAAETLDGAVRLPVEGEADLAAATLRVVAGPARLEFRRGGLQPGLLSPQFAALRDASGVLRLRGAEARLEDGALATSARLTFEGLSARMADVEFTGLSGDLRLSQLAPLATDGPQRLTAASVVAGAPVENASISFSIPPRERGITLRLHEVRAALAGGEVLVRDAAWNSLAEFNPIAVELRNVSIARLLREWRVEGVSGTGRLTGVIPVRAGLGGVAVDDGRVASEGAGVIRVDWGGARERLVSSGEQVALAVNALEDFRYDALTIGLDQPGDGALTVAIGLDGANPAVLDGYPFRFNVTLSGDLAELLTAVRDGRRIGGDLLRGGLGGR